MEIIRKIIVNVLVALYEPFGFAVVFALMFMFVYMLVKEYGWKEIARCWVRTFQTSICFRKAFYMAFYTALILFRTVLNRKLWINPLSNVIGVWGLYDGNGELTTEVIENTVLFIPFIMLLLWNFCERIVGQKKGLIRIAGKSTKIVFLFSLSIELTQLLLRVGTFQLSDLFYNSLGGLIGGLMYWFGYKVIHGMKKVADKEK